jgi:enoyl-CoA hydratase/carnithine racemase
MSRQSILEDVRDGVAVFTLNRPASLNAFDTRMYDELAGALTDARARPDVRVVVVTGAGRAFSAGQDLAEMGALAADRPAGGDVHGFPRFMDALVAFDKPLVAAVNGVGVGVGFTMLLHCDLVYLAEGVRLRLPFVPLGVVPEAASSLLLPLTIGWQAAADLVFTGRWLAAEEARTLGIATAVCPADRLLDVARAKAAEIAAGPPGALQASKRVMLAARADAVREARRREDRAFAERVGSPENLEAIESFLAKRGR